MPSPRAVRPLLAIAVVTVLAAAVAPAPVALGWPNPSGPYDPHAPVSITSNAHFTAANGVRSGTGAIGDPFIISGWSFTTGGITIKGVTASFLIRDNLFTMGGGNWAVAIEDVQVWHGVVDNEIHFHQGGGVSAKNADTYIGHNDIAGGSWNYAIGTGILCERSNCVAEQNMISEAAIGVKARYAASQIRDNNLGVVGNGILVEHGGAGTNVMGNIVANARGYGVWLNYGTNVTISGNLIEQVDAGIKIYSCLAVEVRGNLIHDTRTIGILFESCNATASANTVLDGQAGIQLWQSDAILVNNTVRNHIEIGVHWHMSEGIMANNTITLNGLGLKLQDDGVVRLRGNVFVNNTIGVDIPYYARQSIPYMRDNLVNGISIDGTIDASERAYYYKAANVNVTGALLDSGFSAGFYGATTAQGNLNFYEVDTARVNASVISHGRAGVYVVNSFNVQINSSLISGNQVGVNVTAIVYASTPDPYYGSGGHVVPPCVVFVKNTTITIPVDPPATFGIRNPNCYMGIYNVSISIVDVGIYFGAQASGVIADSDIFRTGTGLHLEGTTSQWHDVVLVENNHVWANKRGALLRTSGSNWRANLVDSNTREGIKLEYGSHPVLRDNNFTRNQDGVLDATSCLVTGPSCSRIPVSRGNTFYANVDRGLVVNQRIDSVGDRFVANGGNGFELSGDVELTRALATANGKNGGTLVGEAVLKGCTVTWNAGNGILAFGTLTIGESKFTRNGEAGIRSPANWISAYKIDASHNRDGIWIDTAEPHIGLPATPYPYLQPSSILFGDMPDDGVSALIGSQAFVHRSTLVGNEQDAIRSGVASVNATYNYWGNPNGPVINTGLTGLYQNGVSPYVQFTPWFRDAAMTQTGPLAGL